MKTTKSTHRSRGHDFSAAPTANPAATWALAGSGALLLWLSQPPLAIWPLAWVALVPWLLLSLRPVFGRREYGALYVAALLYWVVTMQGIRHAHPAMYAAWIALAAYLALYCVAWVALLRIASPPKTTVSPSRHRLILPLWISAPVLWTGLECVRNYFATGISAVMLGHTQADNAVVIQIADAFGSYGVSFVIALVNAAIAAVIAVNIGSSTVPAASGPDVAATHRLITRPWLGLVAAAVTLLATLGYGQWRLAQADSLQAAATPINIALIGRDEPIVFEQDTRRELAIFDAYFRQSHQAAQAAAQRNLSLDAVVWPESMFTGGLPWLAVDPSRPIVVPPGLGLTEAEFLEVVQERQKQFEHRAAGVQYALRQVTGQAAGPDLIVGCSVVSYNDPPGGHSGCVHVGPEGRVAQWYAKMHLVMFGEYIPWINYLPWIDYVVPPGMGILPGDRPMAMPVGDVVIAPNVCIETAVERVPVNQVSELIARGTPPDLIVNVTNDGWFNRTSIVEHHLRCSQLVAVSCRRPVLIAANGGPTAWIDGSGRVAQRLANDASGAVILSSRLDGRNGLYLQIGDWPARVMALLCGLLAIAGAARRRARAKTLTADPLSEAAASPSDPPDTGLDPTAVAQDRRPPHRVPV